MRAFPSRLAFAGLGLGTSLLWTVAAQAAMEPKAVADALVAAMTAEGDTEVSYGGANADGADVVIDGLKLSSSDGGSGEIPSLRVTNPVERQPGGFTAERMSFDNGNVVSEDTTLTWKTGALEQVTIPSAAEIKDKARVTPLSRMTLGEMSIEGKELAAPITIAAVDMSFGAVEEGVPHDMKMAVTDIVLPEALFADSDQKATLDALGYTSFTLDMLIDSGYDSKADTLTFRDVTFDVDTVGKLTFTGSVSGVPLSKLQNREQAQELLATAKVDNATIRFDNTGVVERVLDMQAKSMGATRDQFVQQISGALPLMLNVIGNPGFQEKVAAAASTFLAEPKSLVLLSMPDAPIPVVQIMAAAMGSPQTLPDVMSIDIKANE